MRRFAVRCAVAFAVGFGLCHLCLLAVEGLMEPLDAGHGELLGARAKPWVRP